MATVLKNVVEFTGLVVGVPALLPHGLNVNGISVAPQLGGANAGGFTVTANATQVTVTRTASAASGDVNIYVEHWHTIEAVVPLPGRLVGLVPFFFVADGGGGGSGNSARFRYTANGTELDTFVITFASVGQPDRLNTNYNIQATFGAATVGGAILQPTCPPSLFTTAQFTLVLSAAPTLNDVIMFTVEDL